MCVFMFFWCFVFTFLVMVAVNIMCFVCCCCLKCWLIGYILKLKQKHINITLGLHFSRLCFTVAAQNIIILLFSQTQLLRTDFGTGSWSFRAVPERSRSAERLSPVDEGDHRPLQRLSINTDPRRQEVVCDTKWETQTPNFTSGKR